MSRFSLLFAMIILLTYGFQTGLADKPKEEPKEETMLTGGPKELLPSDAIKEIHGIKVKISQVSKNVLELTIPAKGGYYLELALYKTEKGKMVGEPRIWSQNAVHEITGSISIAGYTFVPDPGKSLIFQVDLKKGYVFLRGQGKITSPDKKTLLLDDTKKGFILGHTPQSPVVKGQNRKPFVVITKGKKNEQKDLIKPGEWNAVNGEYTVTFSDEVGNRVLGKFRQPVRWDVDQDGKLKITNWDNQATFRLKTNDGKERKIYNDLLKQCITQLTPSYLGKLKGDITELGQGLRFSTGANQHKNVTKTKGNSEIEIFSLMIPGSKTSQKDSGWVLKQIKMNKGSTFSSGESNATPVKEYHFPNGDWGLRAVIDPNDPATYVVLTGLPVSLGKIQRYLGTRTDADLFDEPIEPYKAKYSLLDRDGECAHVLKVGPIGKTNTLAIKEGQIYFIFKPKGGLQTLLYAPGTKLVLEEGTTSGGKMLTGGRIEVEFIIRDVKRTKDGKTEVIHHVLYPKVVIAKDSTFKIE